MALTRRSPSLTCLSSTARGRPRCTRTWTRQRRLRCEHKLPTRPTRRRPPHLHSLVRHWFAYVHRSMEGFACRIRRSPSPTRSVSHPSTRPPPTSTAPTMGASPGIPMRPSAPTPLGRRFFASTRAMLHRPESLRITDVPRATRGGLRARRRICGLPYARRTSRAASSRKDRLAITRMGQRRR